MDVNRNCKHRNNYVKQRKMTNYETNFKQLYKKQNKNFSLKNCDF